MALESRNVNPGGKPTMLWRPSSLEEAWQLKRRYGNSALYVAGGTWLRTRWEGGLAPAMPEHVISLENIASLRSLHLQQDGSLTVGSVVRMAEVLYSEAVKEAAPLLKQAAYQIAAPSVRNLATVGGNVMTGTGDLLPALLASEALFIVYDGRRMDRIPAADWLELALKPAELLLAGIKLQPLPKDSRPFFHKVGRREEFTPSILSAAGWYLLDERGRVADIRLAAGGAAMKPLRLKRAEKTALGLEREHAASELHRAVSVEYPDYTDDYASASYRKLAAANLIAAELLDNPGMGGESNAVEP